MAVRVGINGFGRIGRNIMRAALGDADIDFVAVNDLTDAKTLAHLLKYDSVLGVLPNTIKATKSGISVDGDELRVLSVRDYVIVERVEIEAGPGFTVLTGETGAGKSILVDALELLVGARADASVVREGAEQIGRAHV